MGIVRRRGERLGRGTRRAGCLLTGVGLACVSLAGGPSSTWAGDPPREKLDCRIYETKKFDTTVTVQAAQFFFSLSPSIGFSRETGVAWDKVVHGTIARYVELCTRYNAGLVSKEEYETRLREIDGVYREARALEAKQYDATRNRAKGASDDLDRALGAKGPGSAPSQSTEPKPVSQAVAEEVQSLAQRVDQLEPAGRPIDPSAPTTPPDPVKPPATTGTVGAAPDSSIRQP